MQCKEVSFLLGWHLFLPRLALPLGLGNIWGFPTNAAENGGAAFVLMYLILAFLLAYPAMMAELIIGRHTRANMVSALQAISPGQTAKTDWSVNWYWRHGHCRADSEFLQYCGGLVYRFYA